MNRFIIGQYGSFDDKKYKRDFKEGFFGIEACLFSHEHDIANLVKEAKQVGFQIGVHFPLKIRVNMNMKHPIPSRTLKKRARCY